MSDETNKSSSSGLSTQIDEQADQHTLLQSCLDELHHSLQHEGDGAVATHLPELSQANPNWFGLSAVTLDGSILVSGDSHISFTIQSIAKLLILALALEDHHTETILHKIGIEPTGERFDSILYSEDQEHVNLNPFMNAGAIAALDLISGINIEERFKRICDLIQSITNKSPKMDKKALTSRHQYDHQNRAIAYLLLSRGKIVRPVEELLELYQQICCLTLNCQDLAMIAAVLANGGMHPKSKQKVLSTEQVKAILSIMQTCGMYDFSGQWAYRVGLPAKSGLCGAILVVVPGQFGFAIYSPPLDKVHQKSVRGLKASELLSKKLNLHMFRSNGHIATESKTTTMKKNARLISDDDIEQILKQTHEQFKGGTDGHCYNIIPDVFPVDENAFAISITTVDGRRFGVGDQAAPFLIQSMSKVFAYGLALEDHGRDIVLQNVDVEPTGSPYDAIIRLEQRSKRPHNPMVNTGGIATTALIKGDTPAQRLDRVLHMYQHYIGHEVYIEMRSYLAETNSGDRNKAIAYLLRHVGILENDVNDTLNLYLQQCSGVLNCNDLSTMSATLANGGINPITQQRAIKEDYVGDLLTVMYTCGMYDFSGEWSYRIGLPAKSGVSGGILAVVPGQMGIAVYSPRLDQHGNSIAGIKALETISSELGLHIFSP